MILVPRRSTKTYRPCGMCAHAFSLLTPLIVVMQVLRVPGRVGLYEHWNVASGPIYGTLSKGIPHDIYHYFPYLGRQHSVCEYIGFSCCRRTDCCHLACIVSAFPRVELTANHKDLMVAQFAVHHVRGSLIPLTDGSTQAQAADGCLVSSYPKNPGSRKHCTSYLTILDAVLCISFRRIRPGSCS